jgi:hypothetical protein
MRNIYSPRALPPELAIVAFPDPVIEQLGHGPDSPYIEECWLAISGPSATLIWRRMARVALEAGPTPLIIDTTDLLRSVGLGDNLGHSGLGFRAMARVVQFDLARQAGRDGSVMAVRTALPSLCDRQVCRLPLSARLYHEVAVHADVGRANGAVAEWRPEAPDLRPGLVQVAEHEKRRVHASRLRARATSESPRQSAEIEI